jgi:serine protease Do
MILFPLRRVRVALFLATTAGTLSFVFATAGNAQERERRVEREVRVVRTPDGLTVTRNDFPDRAVLGIALAEASRADTAGVRVERPEPNGPASKAGLKPGDVITEINGTSLRLSREDTEDLALTGLGQRRLQRVLAKAKPGDDVKLMVRSANGPARAVTVKTISSVELDKLADPVGETRDARGGALEERVIVRTGEPARERAMIGVSVGSVGNARDTLGLFVNSVVTGGPAEKAGIIEGERIAAVNGVDVRVPHEDLEEASVASARVDRFVREVQKSAPGKTLSLRVYGNGRYRDVTVTAAKAGDLPSEASRMLFVPLPDGPGERSGGDQRGRMPGRLELTLDGRHFEDMGRVIEQQIERRLERLPELLEHVEVRIDGDRTGGREIMVMPRGQAPQVRVLERSRRIIVI